MEETPVIQIAEKPYIAKYLLDNISYELKVSLDKAYLLIEISNKSELENSSYIFKDSIENIYKINRYFLIFETIEEIKNNIVDILKVKENYEIKIEKSEELKLILNPIIGIRIKPIEFSLTKNIISNEDMINMLIDKIHSLEK